MNLWFKRNKCKEHKWQLKERSNVIQFDTLGYPLRLCICQCEKCKKTKQMWLDSSKVEHDIVLKWI